LEGEVMKSSFSNGSVANEKKVLRFIGCGETYALGFLGLWQWCHVMLRGLGNGIIFKP
jgi:hypothetical protein